MPSSWNKNEGQKSTCDKRTLWASDNREYSVGGFSIPRVTTRFHESGIHCRVHIGRAGDRFACVLCITSTPLGSRRRTASDQFSTPNFRRISAHLRYRSLVCDSITQLTPGEW